MRVRVITVKAQKAVFGPQALVTAILYATPFNIGNGKVHSSLLGGGGGGYGGMGGSYGDDPNLGGEINGALEAPASAGSRGANPVGVGLKLLGLGGGRISINATQIHIDGVLSADGQSARQGGGGSGGSILIKAGSLTGQGRITSNGGNGSYTNFYGGGGSGGRISLAFQDSQFASEGISAYGGYGVDGMYNLPRCKKKFILK